MAQGSVRALVDAGVAMVVVPWAAFVAVFVYYAVVTLLAIGIAELSDAFMAAAYGLPVGLYGVMLAARVGRRVVSAFPVHVGPQGVHAFPR